MARTVSISAAAAAQTMKAMNRSMRSAMRGGKAPINRHANAREYFNKFEAGAEKGYVNPDKDDKNYFEEAKLRIKKRGIFARLELLLLFYTFNEDDGRISFFERRKIVKHFKTYRNKISKNDSESLQTIGQSSINDISRLIQQENINKVDINKAIYTVRKICKKTENYNNIIKDLETRLVYNDDLESY